MVELDKYLPVSNEAAFRNGVNKNFAKIEQTFDSREGAMKAHQSTQLKAHQTEQILHFLTDAQKEVYYSSQLDLKTFLSLESARISNLVLGATTDQSVELKDARVDLESKAHLTLYDRLLADFTRLKNAIDKLIEIETGFDLATLEPMFVGNLATYRNAVLQAFVIDVTTNQYYTSQSDSQTPEGFVISHISPNGSKLLSKMSFPNSGHGTTFGIDKTGDKTYIWTGVNDASDNQKLVRVPYVAGGSYSYTTNTKDYTPKSLIGVYYTPVVDLVNQKMLIRRGDGLCELRNLADIKNGVDKVLYSVQIPKTENNDDRPMQGAVSHGTTLYWYSGWSTNAVKVLKYDMTTQKLLTTRELDLPTETGKEFSDGYREPEGMTYYVNPYTGKESLLMAVTSGDTLKRYHIVYALHQRGSQEHFDSIRASSAQNYAYFRGDGRAHSIPTGLTKLSDLRATGVYYLTSDMVNALTDLPSPQFKDAGMFVENKPGEQHYNVRQIVTRSSYGRKNITVERMLDFDGAFGIWQTNVTLSAKQEYLLASDYNFKLANVSLSGSYYITTPQAKLFTDHPERDGDAGWFFEVGSGDTEDSQLQTLIRNSPAKGVRHHRVNNSGGQWITHRVGELEYVKVPLVSGIATETEDFRVATKGDFLIVRGRIKIKFDGNDGAVFANLPSGYRPNYFWEQMCAVGGTTGYTKVTVSADGRMNFYGIDAVNIANVTEVYMYMTIPIY